MTEQGPAIVIGTPVAAAFKEAILRPQVIDQVARSPRDDGLSVVFQLPGSCQFETWLPIRAEAQTQ